MMDGRIERIKRELKKAKVENKVRKLFLK